MLPFARWQWLWIVLAVASLPPVAYRAYQALQDAARAARVQLIQRYSLWETDPQYQGTPGAWTRFASILLNDAQLMQRVRDKHGELADQIEQDFDRDTAFSNSRIVALHLVAWALPLAALYGLGWYAAQRRQRRLKREGHRAGARPPS